MAFDGVIAFQGKDHITASQLGRLIAGTAGTGRYVLRTQNELAASMPNANTVRIATGDLVMDGRYVTNESNVDLAVQSGVSGYKRNDLVVLKYSKNAGTGVETFAPAVLKGTQTTGEPSDPTYSAGDIMGGSTAAVMPLYRIPIDGIRPGTPVKLFDTFSSTEDIRDSVSPTTDWVPVWQSDSISMKARRIGRTAWLEAESYGGFQIEANRWKDVSRLPGGFAPSTTIHGVGTINGERPMSVSLQADGLIRAYGTISGSYWTFSMSWPVG